MDPAMIRRIANLESRVRRLERDHGQFLRHWLWAILNTVQSIPTSTVTQIEYDVVNQSYGDWVTGASAAGKYVIPASGRYIVDAAARFPANIGATEALLIVRHDLVSGGVIAPAIYNFDPNIRTWMTTTGIISATAGDEVYVEVYQDSGSAQDLAASSTDQTFLKVAQIPS